MEAFLLCSVLLERVQVPLYVYVIDRGSYLVGFLGLFVHFKGDILNKIRLWFLIASLGFSCLVTGKLNVLMIFCYLLEKLSHTSGMLVLGWSINYLS